MGLHHCPVTVPGYIALAFTIFWTPFELGQVEIRLTSYGLGLEAGFSTRNSSQPDL